MRSRHRRATQKRVVIADRRRQDVDARCSQVNRRGTVVREPRQIVSVVGRGHRDHVGRVEARWIEGLDVVIETVVACARDEEHVLVVRGVHFIEQRLREVRSSPAVRQHTNVGLARPRETLLDRDRKLHGSDGVFSCAVAGGVNELDGHQARGPVDADHAHPVVAGCADRAGHVGPVILVVHRIARAGDGVESVRARRAGDRAPVDVHGEGGRRGPHVGDEIGMRVVDAGVDYGDNVSR